jgi:hypothetical protein
VEVIMEIRKYEVLAQCKYVTGIAGKIFRYYTEPLYTAVNEILHNIIY